jgi:polyphenol oxidase
MDTLPLYHFTNLSQVSGIKHFISGRKGGVSRGEVGELNLSYRVDDTEEHVRENRRRIASAMNIPAARLVVPAQTHSSNIAAVTAHNYTDFFRDTDALITNEKELCIAVLSADCVPLLLHDPSSASVAAIHAGWRGTVAGIVPKAIEKMKELYGADPSRIIAGIGPSICGNVYEVGEEVIVPFEEWFSDTSIIAKKKENGKYLLDLWEANKRMLLRAGVREENIEISGICTYTNAGEFFSARRSANKAGRFGAGVMLV